MKKAASVLLAAVVSLALCQHIYAFVPQKINSLREDFASRISDIRFNGEAIERQALTRLDARPASVLEIALAGKIPDSDLFLDQNGAPINTADVTVSRMRAGEVTLKADVTSGKEVFGVMELAVRNAGTTAAKPVIRIAFSDGCESLDPVGFSVALYILIGGKEQLGARLELEGVFGNPEIQVDSSDVTVSAEASVLSAGESIPLISIDAGLGVFVDASMRAGGRYLVTAARSRDPYDLKLIEDGAADDVIILKALGFGRGEIKSVRIESEQILQVYDENGNRLGNTSQELLLTEKYYLSVKALRL